MRIDLKKLLLAGTAIVATSAFSAQAQAQDITMAADGIWAVSGGGSSADIENADTDDSVDVNNFILTITDGNTVGNNPAQPNDGGGAGGPFDLGAITDGGAGGDVVVLQSAGALVVSTDSVDVNGSVSINNADAANADVDVTVDGALTTGTTLAVVNNETNNTADVGLAVGGALTVGTTTQITGGSLGAGGSTTDVLVLGNSSFGGLVTIDGGGAHAGNTATLILRGATNAFDGGALLDDNTGVAQLQLDGTVAQTVSGNILANDDNEGALILGNTSTGVVFSGDIGSIDAAGNAIGAIMLNSAGNNAAATFQGDVDVQAITIGDGLGSETHTLTFSSSGTRSVTGTVDGDGGTDTANVTVSGGGELDAADDWGGGGATALGTLTISGSSTLDAEGTIDAGTVVIGSGSTLDINDTLTADVTLSGTLKVTGATSVIGDVTGSSGTIDVDNDASIRGSVTNVTTVDIADTFTLTIDAQDGADLTYSATTTTINDSAGENAGFDLDPVANTINVQSVIAPATAGQGRIQILDNGGGGGDVAFTADIGTTSARLGTLAFEGAGTADTMSTTKSLYVDDITFAHANDSLSFIGDDNIQYVSADLNGNGGNNGDIIVGQAAGAVTSDVRFQGMIGQGTPLDTLTVHPTSRAEFDKDSDFNGNIQNDGEVQVNAGATLTVGGYAAGAGAGTFVVGIDRTSLSSTTNSTVGTDTGAIAGLGAVDISADTLEFNIEGGTLISETLVDVITGVTVAPTITDTLLYDFTGAIVGGDLDVTVAVTSVSSLSATANNLAAANVLLNDATLSTTTDTDLLALQAALGNAATREQFNNILEQAQPTMDGSSFTTAVNIANNSFNMMGDRLAMLRTGEEVTGMTTGNVSQGVRVWGQAFGTTGQQDRRDGIDGYDFDTYGFAAGIDSENIAEDTVIGVAFSYANTQADSDNASRTDTDTDSYQFTIYGDHDFQNDIYLSGMAAYTANNVETDRIVQNNIAHGEYDADQFTVRAEVGRDYAYEGATITPHVMGHWTHFDPDSYTETGAGGAGLVIDPDSLDVIELGIGADVSWLFQNADGSYFKPVLSVGYRHDFANDDVEMTANYVAGGQTFSTNGFDPQQDALDAGVGFTYFSTENWELSAEYDYEWKGDFDAHSGMARAAYRF